MFDVTLVRDPIYLRPAMASDHKAWAALRSASRQHLVAWEEDWSQDDLSVSAFRQRLRGSDKQMRQAIGLPFLIFRSTDRALVGGLTLSNIRFGAARHATLGYWIGADYVRRGYATAAIKAALAHGFETMDLNRIEAACQPENEASRRLLTRCGFVKEGLARDYLLINSKWRDHEIYAMTASDYREVIV